METDGYRQQKAEQVAQEHPFLDFSEDAAAAARAAAAQASAAIGRMPWEPWRSMHTPIVPVPSFQDTSLLSDVAACRPPQEAQQQRGGPPARKEHAQQRRQEGGQPPQGPAQPLQRPEAPPAPAPVPQESARERGLRALAALRPQVAALEQQVLS